MTKDEILSMASQAGIIALGDVHIELEELERFAALVAEKERESCAKEAESWGNHAAAAEIRARGQK
jgi:hypothetical protein